MIRFNTFLLLFLLCITSYSAAQNPDLQEVRETYNNIEFSYQDVSGIGFEEGVTRRDPSDVIKVGDTYYVYYTKIPDAEPKYWGAGYWGATVWCAKSEDKGYSWTEVGEMLSVGETGKWDSQAVFTPNILHSKGKYYLFYTGVKPTPGNEEGEFENNSITDITAIGVAVSDSPTGPFKRVSEEPILKVSVEPEKFDSYRVDDAALLYRNGLYWLYYKGRSLVGGEGGPAHTEMGVAFSKNPDGPYTKIDHSILTRSHEVLIWRQSHGVGALASLSETLEYAPDGINFLDNRMNVKVENKPLAPGLFRPDITNHDTSKEGLTWGVSMIHNGHENYLIRFDIED